MPFLSALSILEESFLKHCVTPAGIGTSVLVERIALKSRLNAVEIPRVMAGECLVLFTFQVERAHGRNYICPNFFISSYAQKLKRHLSI